MMKKAMSMVLAAALTLGMISGCSSISTDGQPEAGDGRNYGRFRWTGGRGPGGGDQGAAGEGQF